MKHTFLPGMRPAHLARYSVLILPLLLALAPATSHAAVYSVVQADKSRVGFTYKQMGVAMDGQFRKFNSQLRFDPQQPTQAQVTFDVDLGSVDAGGPEADQEVAGKSWFNTKAFPTARFVSGAVKATGPNRYEVADKLTIKGQTRDIVVPATFTPAGKSGTFEGAFTIRRGDFSIGEGPWSKFDIVANDVQVKFRIAATAS